MNLAIGSIKLNIRKLVALRAALPVQPKAHDLLPVHDFICVGISGFCGLWLSGTAFAPYSPIILFAALASAFSLHDDEFRKTATDHPAVVTTRLAVKSLPLSMVVLVIVFASDWLTAKTATWLLAWWLTAFPLLLLTRLAASKARPPADEEFVAAYPAPTLATAPIDYRQRAQKTMLDLVVGSLVLLLVLPLLVVIALLIRLETPGPILFRQRRHGYRSGEFEIYKFRTMQVAPALLTDGRLQQTQLDDKRVTRVGRILRKYSLDELPQLFNVLQGTMSLVGPRPHAVNMRTEDRLGQQIIDDYLLRHRFLPGITGLSQVRGLRGATDTTDQLRRRVELDLYYIEHWSLLLDLKILLLTFRAVMKTTNAY